MRVSARLFVIGWALFVVLGLAASAAADDAVSITGAGATFPYPLYAKWAHEYHELAGTKVNYQAIGSGGGIAQIKAKTVDFGASDAPLSSEELNAAGLVQFPLIIGGVVPVVNLEGVEYGKLLLTGELLADIFIGKIQDWDDAAIKAVNPGLALPASPITVVHRADGSGTTWIFTHYLEQISGQWKEKVGAGKAVAWPVGIGGKGNEGVAATVQRVGGALGYVEYAYALQNKMNVARMKNQAGRFVEPRLKTFQAAAAHADWKNAPGYFMVLVNQPGDESWPITGASFILIQKDQPDAAKARAMLRYFAWCLKNGDGAAEALNYVPIPPGLCPLIEATWSLQVRSSGAPINIE